MYHNTQKQILAFTKNWITAKIEPALLASQSVAQLRNSGRQYGEKICQFKRFILTESLPHRGKPGCKMPKIDKSGVWLMPSSGSIVETEIFRKL